MSTVDAETLDRVFRAEYGRTVAVLTRMLGDLDLAEEAVQEAFTVAADRWPSAGLPPSPAGWLVTTARNRALDRLRRESSATTGTPRPRSCTRAANPSRRDLCVTNGCG